jgi:hypothetical protein
MVPFAVMISAVIIANIIRKYVWVNAYSMAIGKSQIPVSEASHVMYGENRDGPNEFIIKHP